MFFQVSSSKRKLVNPKIKNLMCCNQIKIDKVCLFIDKDHRDSKTLSGSMINSKTKFLF